MTEAEWLACTDPAPMFNFLDPMGNERKLRLFACACLHHIWHLLGEGERAAVESSEQYADRMISAEDMYVRAGGRGLYDVPNFAPGTLGMLALESATTGGWFWARHVRARVVDTLRSSTSPAERILGWQRQSNLLRDVFGNPFRPVAVDPCWLTPVVVRLAQTIYDERAFGRLPELAHLLEQAGCTNTAILEHCRSKGSHARGCWVVDLLLGKT